MLFFNEQPASESRVDFENDFEPIRLGVKQESMLIVMEYQVPSTYKRYQHFIQVERYLTAQSMQISISRSQSGSFKDQLK